MFALPLALCLTLFSSVTLPEVTEDHLIILTGSGGQKATVDRLADLMKRWPVQVKLRSGYPKIMRSDEIKSLNPGFIIALAGGCAQLGEALAVRNELRKTIPGVYVRSVARYLPGFIPECPRFDPGKSSVKKPKVPKRYTLEESGPAGKHGQRWMIYVAKRSVAKRKCGDDVLVQLLDAKGMLVNEREEKAHCVEGDPEVDGSSESKVWSAYLQRESGKNTTYVMFTYEMWASDTGCNGGVALCPTLGGMVEEELEGMCNSTGYTLGEGETHCQGPPSR